MSSVLQVQQLYTAGIPLLEAYLLPMANSGVARLGHTGAHALATRGCAPPVQVCVRIIGTDSKLSLSIANRAPNGLQIERRSIAMFIHRITGLVRSPYARVCRILK